MTVFSKCFSYLNPKMWIFEDLIPSLNVPFVISTFVICFLTLYLIKRLESDVNLIDYTKTHSWVQIKVTSRSWYCSICEAFLLHGIGVYCDCCGVCADPECIKKANQKLKCKIISSNCDKIEHHWIKGNLILGAICDICDEECSIEPGLIDYQCCWCQRSVHTDCLPKIPNKFCDFGLFKNFIIPPWCVQTTKRKGTYRQSLMLRGVKDPGWPEWSPLIVIANKKSGNNDGAQILSEFKRFLNPVQVIDLNERKPTIALQWCIHLAQKQIKLLVGGGDGTVAWVLSTSHKLDLDPEPPIAIIPLGTGNDLSRVLRWGKENPSEIDVTAILQDIQTAKISSLDRWKVEIIPNRHLGLKIPNKIFYMYNYMGIGVDAQVALNFHKTRDSAFYIFGSRIFNKLLYLCFGTQQVVTSDCKNLEQNLELYLDGIQINLPELESIVISNIPSWGAGVNLWKLVSNDKQSYNDGILEVLGIYSSFHIAQLQMGISAPIKLGQAKIIEIHLKDTSPIQIDGEPWKQHPCTIKISLVNRCSVLVNQKNI